MPSLNTTPSSNAEVMRKVWEIIERYQGTCNSMDDEDRDWLEGNDMCDYFDGELFECEMCGWWYETCEQADDVTHMQMCEGCHDEEE